MNDDAIRLGIVGGGLITQVAHLPALRRLPARFRVDALADPSPAIRETLAARHAIAQVTPDHAALLERGGLDALLVCSPNGTHAQVVLDALDAGLHVLVEKPLCITARDAAAIAERSRRAGRVVQVGYMKRFDPAYEAFLAQAPVAADLRLVTTATVDPAIGRTLRPPDFVAPGLNGGRPDDDAAAQVAEAVGSDDPRHVRPFSEAFLGALSHDVNLVLGLLDEIGAEVGPVTDAISADDGALAYGALDVGAHARWSSAWMLLPDGGPFREDLRVYAADGVRSLALSAPYEAPALHCYTRELEHFHACVTRGTACRTPAEQGARDVALLTQLYRATVAP